MKVHHWLILFLLLLAGCRKFEYQNTVDFSNIKSYSDLEQATIGAYANFADMFTWENYRNAYIIPCVFGDDIIPEISMNTCGGCNHHDPYYGHEGMQTFDQWGDTIYLDTVCSTFPGTSNGIFGKVIADFYKQAYKDIASQNNIIRQFQDLKSLDEPTRRLLGEIYYMRAYTYYRLTRLFGNILLILDSEVKYTVHRASFEEIYGQIISDLKTAITLLPTYPDKNRYSTVCPDRGTPKALLAEVYLTMGGFPLHKKGSYALAAKYALEVIDSASVYGFGLADDFARLYTEDFVTNKEMVSAVQYKSETYNDFDPNYNFSYGSNRLDLGPFMLYGKIQFMNNCPMNYRKKMTYDMEKTEQYYDTIQHTMVDCTFIPRKITVCYLCPVKKTVVWDNERYFDTTQGYTIYILRYAHILLTYAEASARSGNLNPMSYEAVNEVRRRANKLDIHTPSKYDMTEGLSPQQFADSVVWERAWEFTTDAECRWFDLLRLGMLDTLDKLVSKADMTRQEGLLNNDHFFSIPEQDILLDPNLGTN